MNIGMSKFLESLIMKVIMKKHMNVATCEILRSLILPTESPIYERNIIPTTFPMKNMDPKRPMVKLDLHLKSKSWIQLFRIGSSKNEGFSQVWSLLQGIAFPESSRHWYFGKSSRKTKL